MDSPGLGEWGPVLVLLVLEQFPLRPVTGSFPTLLCGTEGLAPPKAAVPKLLDQLCLAGSANEEGRRKREAKV